MSTTVGNPIQDSLNSIEAEIERLTKARDTLVELINDEQEVEEEAVEAPRRARRRRPVKDTEDEEEVEEKPRRSRSRATADRRPAERKVAKKNSDKADDGDKPARGSRKEQIIVLLEEGMSPREVADELGIATNYVYNVKRDL